MATAVQPAMIMAPAFNLHMNQCQDPDQEFFDFSQLPSPTQPGLKRESSAVSNIASPTSTTIDEDLQEAAKPSHEYERFKQQTGIPSGSIAGLNAGFNSGYPVFSSSGLDMMGNDSMMDGWNSGIGMDMNMGMDYVQNTYMSFNNDKDDFVDPSTIQQEEVPAVRLYPGMHQQQAALAKAQQQAQQQRQQQQIARQRQQAQLHAQQQQQQRPTPQSSHKTSSPLSDARTEETIQRVVAQIRADSQNAALASQDPNGNVLPHIIRAKKDEEDMDEDERLLASEEGKKLSSKERRQLRNKVSARAFRSRRKEYIGQLEGEVAMKVQEANELRNQNRALMEENARSRAFIERLLRHTAFGPFLEDLVAEENISAQAPLASMPSTSTPVVSAPAPAPAPFQFSQPENTHVGMTMVPETQLDFSMLNINNNANNNANWNMNNGFNGYQPRVFAVTELPEGPVNPLDVSAMSGKGHSTIFVVEDEASTEEELKPEYPIIERPVQSQQPTMAAIEEDEAEDEEYDLYRSSPALSAAPSAPVENLFTNPEKASRFTLVVADEATEAMLAERLERKMAAMDPAFQRIAAITSMLDY
ncbi:hypothetical protein BU25DRAFT_441652 [Macroventuria anomochaeta]|uniref:Uncharacterized protein n=1 Tax=Macroventuria anomochaeta TaxID=301207 RepID=A0ACB6RS84_9PLEO|nr:uncharacterized protein BU25DRAFT_441652 [Macroventuria anomochaeta]KAF2624845.1 hypothetical protein BU25DRAFT_441652 [Macroventuria anomochaeta]